jgi:hypothetical protein
MSRVRDEERPFYKDIKPRKHVLSQTPAGRFRYPFRRMIVNDYFVIESWNMALAVRNALKSLYRRKPSLKFTVRQASGIDGVWIVRRVA